MINLENKINIISDLVTSVALIAEKMKSVDEKVDRLDTRLADMEKAPLDNAKHFRKTAISSVISAVLGAVVAAVAALVLK